MTNIFIGLSQNQINNYELLLPSLSNDDNILITSKTLKYNSLLYSKIILTSKSFNNQPSSKFNAITNIIEKIKSYKQIISNLKEYKKNKELTLYFTYIEDILTNYLFFSFNKNIKGIVVEDGTLNYYSHTIDFLDAKKLFLKKTLSRLYGIPFKKYKGHSSGIEYKHTLKQYVRIPELSLFPEKSKQLPYKRRTTNLNDSILIIGQEGYINQFGLDLYLKRLKKLLGHIKRDNSYTFSSTIYYKPHRHGQRIDYELLKKEFHDKKVVILKANEPLEDLYFNQLGSKNIFAFDSSALLNIYLEAQESIRHEINFTVLLKYNKELKSIFKRFNFTIFE